MKKIGEYTARGKIESDGFVRLFLDDGSFKTGYRLVSFDIAPSNVADATQDTMVAKVCTKFSTTGGAVWDWSDNTEIAWGMSGIDMAAPVGVEWSSRVDPDNLIVQDCFIHVNEEQEQDVNYMVKFEKYDITDWQGALAMVRNNSQNVD
jgi:hypothetical protein